MATLNDVFDLAKTLSEIDRARLKDLISNTISKDSSLNQLMVKNEYRRHGYGSMLWRYLCGELLAEKKEVYSFYYSDESRRLHHKIGFTVICNWAKILIND